MTFNKILVATDFSDCSQRALDLAVELALKFESELVLVHSWEAPAYSYGGGLYLPVDLVTPIEQAATAQLEKTLSELRQRLPRAVSRLRSGSAWQEVLDVASAVHADLIVLGTHGRQGLTRALLGSVAEKVVRLAAVPVLTVHGPANSR